MKCLCGFKQKPDNVLALKSHMEKCSETGRILSSGAKPFVIWKDQEFTVVTNVAKGETAMDIGFVPPKVVLMGKEDSIVQEPVQASAKKEESVDKLVVQEEEQKKAVPKKRAPAKKKASGAK